MALRVWMLVVTLSLLDGDRSQDAIPKAGGSRLEGVWACMGEEVDGFKSRRQELQLTVKGDQWITEVNGGPATTATFKVDTTKRPMMIDLAFSAPRVLRRETRSGIYSLDGDKLTVCFSVRSGEKYRPADFTTAPQSCRELQFFKRVKR
jgi:uncharacterized protein (TIGR03067 family)